MLERCSLSLLLNRLTVTHRPKTCILRRFVDDAYAETFPTLGVDLKIRTIQLEGKVVKLHIVSTHTFTFHYFRDLHVSSGCLLILRQWDTAGIWRSLLCQRFAFHRLSLSF